jgi:hypothetical protein
VADSLPTCVFAVWFGRLVIVFVTRWTRNLIPQLGRAEGVPAGDAEVAKGVADKECSGSRRTVEVVIVLLRQCHRSSRNARIDSQPDSGPFS